MFSKPRTLHLTAGSAVFLDSCNLWLRLCRGSENCFLCQHCCLLCSETREPNRFGLTCQNVLTKVHKIKTHGCSCLHGLRLLRFSWSLIVSWKNEITWIPHCPMDQRLPSSRQTKLLSVASLGSAVLGGALNLQHTCIILRKLAVLMYDLWSLFSNPYKMFR